MEAEAIGWRLNGDNLSEIEERERRSRVLERENCKREVCIRDFCFWILLVFIKQLGGVHKVLWRRLKTTERER
jgi:hypothetical protein